MYLKEIDKNIWIYDGSTVSFYGFPFTTRMTVIKLSNGKLWIHSPEKIKKGLLEELKEIGEIKYLISPNKLHHIFNQEWMDIFPEASCYAAPGLVEKRSDIKFNAELSTRAESDWQMDIDQTIIEGSPAMEEVVFYHKTSKTLILTDAIENFQPSSLSLWIQIIAKIAGVLAPNGKMPLDWRLSFYLGNRDKARNSLQTILSWDIDNIILAHGECIIGNGHEFIKKSYSWLIKT